MKIRGFGPGGLAPLLALAMMAAVHLPVLGQSTIDQIRAHHEGLAVWWTGNAGWLIKADDLLIGIDLDLGTEGKVQLPPVTGDVLSGLLDVAFVSHHHGDHCHVPTLRTLAGDPGCRFVLPPKCLTRVQSLGIDPGRIIVPEPGHTFQIEGVEIRPVHAIHGNQNFTVLTREPDFVDSIAHSCGYLLALLGTVFFHPGDSVLTEEHLSLERVDVLFVSPTVHNMYVDRSMILINHLQPRYILPQHFGTYRETDQNAFWTRGYPDELRMRLSKTLQERYHKLDQGQVLEIR